MAMAGGADDDFYELLGLDASADDDAVRRAYRQLAMRWHPDRAGPDTTFVFQRLAAAYAVLADPAARAAYDRQRGARPRDGGDRSGPATSATAGDAASAAPTTTPRRRAPGVLLRRLSSPLNVLLACGIARRAQDGVLELFIDAEEAAEGGMVTISMRVPVRCPDCEDAASAAPGACARCGASRAVEELFSAWLAVPPGVAEGTLLRPSVLLPGMLRPVVFRVRLAAPR